MDRPGRPAACAGCCSTPATRCRRSSWRCRRSSWLSSTSAWASGSRSWSAGCCCSGSAVMVARGFARFERIRLRGHARASRPQTPAYLCPRPEDGFWRKALLPLRDAQSWLDVALVPGRAGDRHGRVRAHARLVGGGRGRPHLLVLAAVDPLRPRRQHRRWPSCWASARAGTPRSCSTWSSVRWRCVTLPLVMRFAASPARRPRPRAAAAAAPSSSRRYAGSRAAATPPAPPRRTRCAGSSATSTTGRSSGWCG